MRPVLCFGVVILLAACLLVPLPPLAVAEEAPAIDWGVAKEMSVYPSMQDERIVAIQQEAKEKIAAIWEEITNLGDPSEEPALQKEIEEIKSQEEIAIFEAQLEMATEKGDVEQISAIKEALDSLYYPKEASYAPGEPTQD